MKRFFQVLVVAALVLIVVGVARTNPTLAERWNGAAQSQPMTGFEAVSNTAAQPLSIVVTGSGSYLVGGVCMFDAEFKATDIKVNVDAEVPVKDSRKVPFGYPDQLYYPGCHVVHFKQDQAVEQANAEDGDWKVCFGKRSDMELTIYYYLDNPPGGSRVWIPLPTSVEGDYACAPALYTGVYMPAGKVIPGGPIPKTGPVGPTPSPGPGTVRPPSSPNVIRASGTYAMGGVCTLKVVYKTSGLMNRFYVEFPVEDTALVAFPDNGDLLFFPGCHVLHYQWAETQKNVTDKKGKWQICFAAPPTKKVTIYFYESLVHEDSSEQIAASWLALPTTVENGLACAPAMGTGVYVPAGQ